MKTIDAFTLLNQEELALRWKISEATLERWRHTKIGPVYLKLGGAVRYNMRDVLAYEHQSMSDSEIDALHARISALEDGLRAIECEPINAEYMARNILHGLPAHHLDHRA